METGHESAGWECSKESQWIEPPVTGYEFVSPEMFSLVEIDQRQLDSIVQTVPGGAENIQDIYPLSPLQEGMLFHHLLNQQSDTYFLSTLFEMQSHAQVSAMTHALQKVIDRHDILRTAMLSENLPRPMQVVYRRAVLPVEELAVSNSSSLQEIKKRMRPRSQTMDLTRAPLLRLYVVAGGDGAPWYGLLQVHHLICDYQSVRTVIAEMRAILENREQQLTAPTAYRHYMAQVLEHTQAQDAEAFFRGKLGDVSEPTAPFALLDVHGDGTHIEEARDLFEPEMASQVRLQARRMGVSAARMFHAAWALVVARTSGKHDVVFGTVLSTARRRGTSPRQPVLGLSINTLPLRLQMQNVSASELVLQTHRELLELLSHAAAPLTLVQRCSGISGTAPLFTSLLNYRRAASDAPAEAGKTEIRELEYRGSWTNYPIALQVDDLGEGFAVMAQTDSQINPRRMIEYLRTAMQSLLEALEHAPQTPALLLAVLPESEQRQIVESFNATRAAIPQQTVVHELFEEQAQRRPDAIAVVCADQQITYGQLNRRANQWAHALSARGVRPDERVGLYAERSVEMVAGLLGILKAGGAYVPLDVSYPLERLQYMIEDSAPLVLLTQERLRKNLSTAQLQVLTLDADQNQISDEPDCNLNAAELGLQTRHLAYVVYTSGSTGAPKGVAVEHRSVVNLVQWHCTAFELSEASRCSSVAAMGFDAAGWEIWPPLSMGATLLLAPSDAAGDSEKLLAWWEDQSLDVSFLPTPLAEYMFSRDIAPQKLRTLLVGGDRLRHRPVSESFALVNNYGPTESTVVATSGCILAEDRIMHIGRPIANTQIYILDALQQVAPVGVAGEIYVGGVGVARGYLHRPELTAQRFLADPFSLDPQARLYRTGDVGRWRPDGTIEYLGRNDHQVKIRGYRIELGEIEAQLAQHPQVKDAVVIVREEVSGERYLVAYFTPGEQSVPVEELREHLKTRLPEYMIPTAFVVLDRLPLTSNGKLDLKALPVPEVEAYARGHHEPPQGEIEAGLAGLWQESLRVGRVGRHDNFFELGGHSLLAVKSLFEINRLFGCTLKVTDVYRNPILRDLAARVSGSVNHDELVDLSREAVLDEAITAASGIRNAPARNVLLTGATGFVGRFLLAQLLKDTGSTVYCLVRGRSQQHALSRLKSTLEKWKLWRSEFDRRIVVIMGDLGRPRLGVEDDAYQVLVQTIDSIYHCATSMNHLESYAMAKATNVDAARELLKLATHGRPKLVNYVSTLGIFGSYAAGTIRVVDELTAIEHEKHSTARGYAASKWVGEKIFMTASGRGIPCNIFRVGLVWADTQHGRYDELQQGYRIFKSCLLSGYGIEQYRFLMPPTPVDYVACSIVFLANRHHDGRGVFHISASEQLIEDVFKRCNQVAGTSLEVIPYYDWVCEMKRLHQQGQSLPAVPLIEYAFSMNEAAFYEHQRNIASANIRFDCTRTHRELEGAGIVAAGLDDELLKLYVETMLSMDTDLHTCAGPEFNRMLPMRESALRFDGLGRAGGD